jgi:CheY-like chemotaxis protein
VKNEDARTPPTRSGTQRRIARVLIIDDERLFASVLQCVLSQDFEVVTLHTASDALARLRAGEVYDLILCDVVMPSMDGVEFFERLSATKPSDSERVVFMSGGSFPPQVQAFFASIPNVLMAKPLHIPTLRTLIERRGFDERAAG